VTEGEAAPDLVDLNKEQTLREFLPLVATHVNILTNHIRKNRVYFIAKSCV
jgi:hypothetical protein